jgi:hypothetical protein
MTHVRRTVLAGLALVGFLLTGCDDQPATPTTVIVNTPPADAGLSVLLTIMIVAAFLGLIAAVVAGWGWACERRARLDAERAQRLAEDAVLALSGKPVEQVWVSIADRNNRPSRAVQRRPE